MGTNIKDPMELQANKTALAGEKNHAIPTPPEKQDLNMTAPNDNSMKNGRKIINDFVG